MPEGDTIHRVAARLRPAIEGQALRRIVVTRHVGPLPEAGEYIDAVHARGKHLLIDFSGGLTLRAHLRMTGSWHLYRTGERWTRRAHAASVVLDVDDWTAVCFAAPDVTVTRSGDRETAHLGPDLCVPGVDVDEAVARFTRFVDPDTPIGVALLDQRVAAGIGNVYKCDVLHLRGIDPRRRVAEVSAEERKALLSLASELLQANLTTSSRQTVPGGLAVYGREGEPCRRCGTTIERFRQGREQPRSTWWCPGCQLG